MRGDHTADHEAIFGPILTTFPLSYPEEPFYVLTGLPTVESRDYQRPYSSRDSYVVHFVPAVLPAVGPGDYPRPGDSKNPYGVHCVIGGEGHNLISRLRIPKFWSPL